MDASLQAMSIIELKFSGRKLSCTDPIVQVSIQQGDKQIEEVLGQTERIRNNRNPDWATPIVVDYFFEEQQLITCNVYDLGSRNRDEQVDRSFVKQSDRIGSCTFPLGKLVASKGQALTLNLDGRRSSAELTIHAEVQDVTNDLAHFRFRVEDLPTRKTLCGFITKCPQPAVVIRRVREDGQWVKVIETETANSGIDASFQQQTEHVLKLCNGDVDRPLQVEVVDKSKAAEPVIALMETTLRNLEESQGNALKMNHYTHAGSSTHVKLMSNVIIEKQPTFMDYIKGGLQLNLHIAIDFTASNGDPMDADSLHCLLDPTTPNPYESVITSVCKILENYDSDQMFPVNGFGASPAPGESTSHRFSCDPEGGEVSGLDGILNAYRSTVQRVRFSGPTLFAPMLHGLIGEVKQSMHPDTFEYNILLILTDGCIHDMDNTIDAIVKSSSLPISIIIVGVGEADFEKMDALDADDQRLISPKTGKVQVHDNVQFVPFRDCGSNGPRLAREVLKELPDQVVHHFHQGRKMPPPSPQREEHSVSYDPTAFMKCNPGTPTTMTPPASYRSTDSLMSGGSRMSGKMFTVPTAPQPNLDSIPSGVPTHFHGDIPFNCYPLPVGRPVSPCNEYVPTL